MDVILLERVEKLGAIGDVVKVKDGFARNFLLPNKKAMRANEANRKVFEANRARIESDNANRRGEAEKEAEDLQGRQRHADPSGVEHRPALRLGRGARSGRGAGRRRPQGRQVGRSCSNKPIKAIGVYEVNVALHPEVSVTVKVNVARSPEEAEMQASGVDVMAAMFEKDEAGFIEDYDPNAEPGATAEVPADAAPEGEAQQG